MRILKFRVPLKGVGVWGGRGEVVQMHVRGCDQRLFLYFFFSFLRFLVSRWGRKRCLVVMFVKKVSLIFNERRSQVVFESFQKTLIPSPPFTHPCRVELLNTDLSLLKRPRAVNTKGVCRFQQQKICKVSAPVNFFSEF